MIAELFQSFYKIEIKVKFFLSFSFKFDWSVDYCECDFIIFRYYIPRSEFVIYLIRFYIITPYWGYITML